MGAIYEYWLVAACWLIICCNIYNLWGGYDLYCSAEEEVNSSVNGRLPAYSCECTLDNYNRKLEPPAQVIPALFLLGDSILDSGNNNHFVTLAKVDHFPYGIDFPGNLPSGRFSNGFNAADYIAFKLGLPLIPAYHNPSTTGKRLLQGVNFASGGSGILPNTGKIYGTVESLQEQVKRLQDVKDKVIELVGETAAAELFASAAFVVVTGSNDWLLSFFNPILPIRIADNTSSQRHRDILIQTLLPQIEALYEVGARKIVVAGLPALGCCPSQVMEFNSEDGACVEEVNEFARDYNEKLLPQLLALNHKLGNASIAYIDIYSLILEAAQNPSQFGFKTGNRACCGIGKYKGFLTCLPGLHPCENVEDHFYWDAYHPTQKFYPFLIDRVWSNGPPYSYPNSLQELFAQKTSTNTKSSNSHIEL